jgi:hypothetical protein
MAVTRPPLVTALPEAREATLAFAREVRRSPALAGRMAYCRAWTAIKDEDGWHYAPARWAGHRGLDAAAYLATSEAMDARRSDATRRPGSPPSPTRGARRSTCGACGSSSCARAGSAPQRPPPHPRGLGPRGRGGEVGEAQLVALLEAVYRGLSVPAQAAFRRRIS